LPLQHSRRHVRIDADDELVPLADQNRSLWDREAIAEGRALIEKALMRGRPGVYQIQAAMTHCGASDDAAMGWGEVAALYEALEALQPTPVITLNRGLSRSPRHEVRPPHWS